MTNIQPIHQIKYLSIKDYLEYEKIEGSNWDKLNEFFKEHDLPTTDDLRDKNLRMYIWNLVHVKIYDMNQIKKADPEEFLDFD